MAQRLAYLEAVIGADVTQFRKGMRDIRNEAGILGEDIGGMAGVGRALTYTVTAPLLAAAGASFQVASEFDANMRNVNSIARLNEEEFGALSDRILKYGSATRSGAIATAEALYTIFSAGLTQADVAERSMQIIVKTAEAGLANTETTAEAIISAMLSYGDTSEEFTQRVSDSMTQMVLVGKGSMQEFAGGIAKVMPAAVKLGIEIEELFGDMAFLTQRGLQASVASTYLRQALVSLQKPTEAMKSAFAQLGVKGGEELIEKFGGLNEGIKALVGTTDGGSEALNKLFSNIRGATAITLMANDFELLDQMIEEFNEGVIGATDLAHEQQMLSHAAAVDRMKSAWEGAGAQIGEVVAQFLRPGINFLTDLGLKIVNADKETVKWATSLGALLAAAGPVLWLFASLPTGLLAFTGALAAVSGIDFGNLDEAEGKIKTFINDVFGDENVEKLRTGIQRFLNILFPFRKEAKDAAAEGAKAALDTSGVDPFTHWIENTGNYSVSLHSFYEKFEFDGVWSWSDFLDAATKGGWTGGAIDPGESFGIIQPGAAFKIQIDPTLESPESPFIAFDLATEQAKADPLAVAFSERWKKAVDLAAPLIQIAITDMMNRAGQWILDGGDELIGEHLGRFAVKVGTGFITAFRVIGDFVSAVVSGGGIEGFMEGLSGFHKGFVEGFRDELATAGEDMTGSETVIAGIIGAIFGVRIVAGMFLGFGGRVATMARALIARSISLTSGAWGLGVVRNLMGSISAAIARGTTMNVALDGAVASGFAPRAARAIGGGLRGAASLAMLGVKTTIIGLGAWLAFELLLTDEQKAQIHSLVHGAISDAITGMNPGDSGYIDLDLGNYISRNILKAYQDIQAFLGNDEEVKRVGEHINSIMIGSMVTPEGMVDIYTDQEKSEMAAQLRRSWNLIAEMAGSLPADFVPTGEMWGLGADMVPGATDIEQVRRMAVKMGVVADIEAYIMGVDWTGSEHLGDIQKIVDALNLDLMQDGMKGLTPENILQPDKMWLDWSHQDITDLYDQSTSEWVNDLFNAQVIGMNQALAAGDHDAVAQFKKSIADLEAQFPGYTLDMYTGFGANPVVEVPLNVDALVYYKINNYKFEQEQEEIARIEELAQQELAVLEAKRLATALEATVYIPVDFNIQFINKAQVDYQRAMKAIGVDQGMYGDEWTFPEPGPGQPGFYNPAWAAEGMMGSESYMNMLAGYLPGLWMQDGVPFGGLGEQITFDMLVNFTESEESKLLNNKLTQMWVGEGAVGGGSASAGEGGGGGMIQKGVTTTSQAIAAMSTSAHVTSEANRSRTAISNVAKEVKKVSAAISALTGVEIEITIKKPDKRDSGSGNRNHEQGLDFVPYDGYNATLHRGEKVLPKLQADRYRAGAGGEGGTKNVYITIEGMETTDQVIDEIARRTGVRIDQ